MSVRHMLISCSLIALLGAPQGAWAMMGDEEDESSKNTATASKSEKEAAAAGALSPFELLQAAPGQTHPAMARILHYLTPENEPQHILNLSTMSNYFKQNTKAMRDKAEEEFCQRQREIFARKFQDSDIFESMHILEELTGLYPKVRAMALLDFAGSQNRLLDMDPSQIFDAANRLSGNEKSAIFRALALNSTVNGWERFKAFRAFAQMIPLSEGLELVRRLCVDETLVFSVRADVALALPEPERNETFRMWALDPERTQSELICLRFSSRYGLGEPQGGLDVRLLRSLSQHVNANSRLRVESASDLPIDDPVRLAVLHEIAFDENVELGVRLNAAGDLPEGEEKTQLLQELQVLVAQEEQEAPKEQAHRLDASSSLPEMERNEVLSAWASDENLELYQRIEAAKALPEGEEKNQILQELQAVVEQEAQEEAPEDENEVEVII